MHSFDVTFGPLDFALKNRLALDYPCGYEPELAALRQDGTVLVRLIHSGVARWQAHLGDFPALLEDTGELPAPHAVFYDPYSPTVNPEMWTLETFAALHARLRADTPCLLTTYTRSTAVRVTLLLAGFFVGVGGATGEKDETTVAANTPALLATSARARLAGERRCTPRRTPRRLRAGVSRRARGRSWRRISRSCARIRNSGPREDWSVV